MILMYSVEEEEVLTTNVINVKTNLLLKDISFQLVIIKRDKTLVHYDKIKMIIDSLVSSHYKRHNSKIVKVIMSEMVCS